MTSKAYGEEVTLFADSVKASDSLGCENVYSKTPGAMG